MFLRRSVANLQIYYEKVESFFHEGLYIVNCFLQVAFVLLLRNGQCFLNGLDEFGDTHYMVFSMTLSQFDFCKLFAGILIVLFFFSGYGIMRKPPS